MLMGQGDKKTIWNLIAKKLAGEASPEEIRELEWLLKNNPELHYPMRMYQRFVEKLGRPQQGRGGDCL